MNAKQVQIVQEKNPLRVTAQNEYVAHLPSTLLATTDASKASLQGNHSFSMQSLESKEMNRWQTCLP